jgi:hypothetical protein
LRVYTWIIEATRWRLPDGAPLDDVTDIATGRDLIIEEPPTPSEAYHMSFAPPTPLSNDAAIIVQWIDERIDTEWLVRLPRHDEVTFVDMIADGLRDQVFGYAMPQPDGDSPIPATWCGISRR